MFVACVALGLLGAAATVTAGTPETGVSFSVKITGRQDDEGNQLPVTRQQVDQTIIVLKKRLKAMGHLKSHISRKNGNGFVIRVDGVAADQLATIANILGKPGKLELKEVCPRNDELGADGKSLAQRVQDGQELVPGYRAYSQNVKDEHDHESKRPILLNRRSAIENSDIANAYSSPQQADAVAITLNNDGTNKMVALTKNMRPGHDRIAIVLDGEVISAPVVNQVPLGKNFIIEGFQQPGEVQILANCLINPLEFPLVIERERAVPTREVAK